MLQIGNTVESRCFSCYSPSGTWQTKTFPVSHIFTNIKFFCCAWKWGKTVVTPGRLFSPTHTPWAIQGDAANPGEKLFIYMCHRCISGPAFCLQQAFIPSRDEDSLFHLQFPPVMWKKVIQIHRSKVRGNPRDTEHSFYRLLLWSGDNSLFMKGFDFWAMSLWTFGQVPCIGPSHVFILIPCFQWYPVGWL